MAARPWGLILVMQFGALCEYTSCGSNFLIAGEKSAGLVYEAAGRSVGAPVGSGIPGLRSGVCLGMLYVLCISRS